MERIKNTKGFTMLELAAVIGIIVIGLLGVSALVVQNIKVQYTNKNYLIASMLAQEGLELVRNKRDNNWVQGYDWKLGNGSGSDTDIVQDGSYIIDYTGAIDDSPDDISANAAELKLDASGYYGHSGVTDTPFHRLISVIDKSDYVVASSTVSWQDKGAVHYYTAETYLYNWR